MALNAIKNTAIHFGKSSLIFKIFYLGNAPLLNCESLKYLGVQLSGDNSWNTRIVYICLKALRILGLIKKHNKLRPLAIKLIAYKGLCRPILEYWAEVRDRRTWLPSSYPTIIFFPPLTTHYITQMNSSTHNMSTRTTRSFWSGYAGISSWGR